jgi:hypothetical protein
LSAPDRPHDDNHCPDCGGYHDEEPDRNLVTDLVPVACTVIFFRSPKAWISTWVNNESGEFTPPHIICWN